MFFLKMAFKPLLHLAIWTAAATCVSADTPNLPSDVTKLVPSCSLDCFESFVTNNYDIARCGSSPSLSCLCQNTGSSGFTIGEGAVQCLVAEINREACQGGDASQQAISKVFAMCSSVQNAAPETHATIVATLVIPSGTGPVQVVPGGTSTAATSSQASASVSTSGAVSITPVVTTSPTTLVPNVGTSTTPSPTPTSNSTGGGPPLNTAQIAGISVGIAATLGFAIGLIFLARCVRKRNFGDQESIIFKPKRESKGFGMINSNQNSPRALQISAPIHKTPVDMEFRRPGDFQRQREDTIGLAVSPIQRMGAAAVAQGSPVGTPMGVKQPPRTYKPYTPMDQNLPKPTLTLTIPQVPGQPQKEARTLQSSRDSVMTEFQEDGEGQGDGARGSNIWRPPPTDPQSAKTYYVADTWGNWVLINDTNNSKTAELSSPMNRTKAGRAMDAVLEPPVNDPVPTARGGQLSTPGPTPLKDFAARSDPPIEFKDRQRARTSSSVYSGLSLPQPVMPGVGNPLPLQGGPHTASTLTQQDSDASSTGQEASKRRKSRRGSRQNKRRSQDSATTIASSVAEMDEEANTMEDTLQEGLSPVAESPRTPVSAGRSPVTYPRLLATGREAAERRAEQKYKHLPTPPKAPQPVLTLFPRPTRNEPRSPPTLDHPGHPISTLGAADVSPLRIKRNPSVPQQAPRVPASRPNPNPVRNPAEFKSGSPDMRSGSAALKGERQRHPSPLHQHQPYQQHHRRGSSLQLQHQQQQSQLQDQQSTGSDLHRVGGQDNHNLGLSGGEAQRAPGGLQDRIFISSASATTSGSVESAGSSFLLTKRLGADRAAALTLGEDLGTQSARRVKWQREQGGPGFVGHDTAAALPATPGWLPKLTPTRRGDDLFLNVQ